MAMKTISDAVERLPKRVADHIVKMFKATGYVDFHDGNLGMYLERIERAGKRQESRLSSAEKTLAAVRGCIIHRG